MLPVNPKRRRGSQSHDGIENPETTDTGSKKGLLAKMTMNLSMEVFVDEFLDKRIVPDRQKILYVGMKYDYGFREWGLSYEHYNLYLALQSMGYSLVYFDYQNFGKRFGTDRTTALLKEAVYYYHPNLLFYVHIHDVIDHDAWKGMDVKKVIHLADDHWRYEETKPVWELFDNVITTDVEGYQKRTGKCNVILSQWGVNLRLYRKMDIEKKYDVTFIGRVHSDRQEFVNKLRAAGISVRTFGVGWDGKDERISQADMVRIINQSKIVLNMSMSSKGGKIQVKGRDFEVTCCGSMLLTQDSPEIRKCFLPGEEIAIYKDVQDAIEQCRYYLENDEKRESIAERGRARTLLEHTAEYEMRKMLKGVGL